MARPLTLLVVFFVSMNLLAGVLSFTGISAALGLSSEVGQDDIGDSVPSDSVATGAPTGQTLFGMYNVLAGQLSRFFGAVFPGLAMLRSTIMPNWLVGNPQAGSAFAKVGILAPLMSVLIFVDIVSFLRGWSL
jgi:hypothetical protein